MKVKTDPLVKTVFERYPDNIRPKIDNLRRLIIESANELSTIDTLEETLKWGEPSYIAPYGSTIRIDWNEKTPGFYSVYFKCTSKLVVTFKEVFGPLFKYENDRAIRFEIEENIPESELKECIKASLMYHKVKTKTQLGIVAA